MNILKRIGSSIWIALAAFGVAWAAIAATQRKDQAKKWQQTADDIAQGNTAEAIDGANKAMTQAKYHKAEAKRIAATAQKRIDRMTTDETMADIVDSWRTG